MEVIRFNDAREFLRDALPLLMAREAENNLILGRASIFAEKSMPEDALLVLARDSGRTVAAAMMTPPHRLVLTDGPDEAIAALARWAHDNRINLPGVCGPIVPVKTFLDQSHRQIAARGRLLRSLRIYQLENVTASQAGEGHFTRASEADTDLLVRWCGEFAREIGESCTSTGTRESVVNRLAERQIFLWRLEQTVSMAAWAGPTANGVRINLVYTPPEHRSRGYASACVAALSQQLLDSGKKFCFLYTDLANPTSKSIYQKMGYCPVCDWADYSLEEQA